MKKVTANGTVTLHHHYLYRGYLQIAALDLTATGAPALWHTLWDPTDPVATRPLSLRKNGTWYTYGHDLTKNITELYKTDDTIATTYDYTPYGAVTANGIDQPFQWSSEVYDAELGMVYYNYRHYNPMDGRWISRDQIAEKSEWNLYTFSKNTCTEIDILGNLSYVQIDSFVGHAWIRTGGEYHLKDIIDINNNKGVTTTKGSRHNGRLISKNVLICTQYYFAIIN